jgi:hypothetical protein
LLAAVGPSAAARGADPPEPLDVPLVVAEHEEPAILDPPPDTLSVEELAARLQALEV